MYTDQISIMKPIIVELMVPWDCYNKSLYYLKKIYLITNDRLRIMARLLFII